MSNWPAVHGLVDGNTSPVNADTFNRPLFELAERTNYLYNQLQQLIGQNEFDSVRLPNAPLDVSDQGAPVVGDVVYLDPVKRVFTRAAATMAILDEFIAAEAAYAIGVLIAKDGSTGTVLMEGKLPLQNTDGSPWLLSSLLVTGETFRNGQYYLSSQQPGKLTAYPQGAIVYVGFFMQNESSPLYGDYAIVSPQLRDTGESHVHRSFPLIDQVAGRQVTTGVTPSDTVYAVGFYPEIVAAGDWQPRLVVTGTWLGGSATQYTCWLSDNTTAGGPQATSLPPTNFGTAYLNWLSSDAQEGQGYTRIWSFESPVTIGTKGLRVTLENPNGYTPLAGADWSIPYQSSADTPAQRTWVFSAPDETRGWLARRWRQYFAGQVAVNNNFSLLLIGGPHVSPDGRSYDNITAVCAEVHEFTLVLPTAHQTTVIGSTTYEYTQDGTFTAGHLPVTLTAAVGSTYQNLVTAILAKADPHVTPVLDLAENAMAIGTPFGTTVVHRLGTIPIATPGAGNVTVGSSTASLLVYDKDNQNLVTNYGSLYWGGVEFWQFVSLKNGLQILVIPFNSSGGAKTADGIALGDTWTCQITDQANGAQFYYAVGMDQALNQFYPPVPAKAASFMRNGVEMSDVEFNPLNPTIALGTDTIHWYSNQYGTAPWPTDWINDEQPGDLTNQQEQRLHFVKMTIGNSGVVTSLRPAPNSPIRVLQCGTGTPGTVGDLALDMMLDLQFPNGGLAGYNVVKGVQGNILLGGPVVERIIPGPGISVTQSAGAPQGQGVVTISAGQNAYQGDFDTIALLNAKEERIGLFSYIRLLGWSTGGSNTNSGFTAQFRVPHTVANVPYRVILYATVFGEQDIPFGPNPSALLAGINFTYSILPDVFAIDPVSYPATSSLNLQSQLLQPASVMQTVVPFGDPTVVSGSLYKGFDPILVHNNDQEGPDLVNQRVQALGSPFPNVNDFPAWATPSTLGVRPGSLVAVQFNRTGIVSGREYTGALGFINLRWVLVTL